MYPNGNNNGGGPPPPNQPPGPSAGWPQQQPPNGQQMQYPPRSQHMPPIAAALTSQQQPPHPDAYRSGLPPMAHPNMYPNPSYPPMPPGYGPPPGQPAPRQRTAIACRYCRRRKIRCSGFDTSEDGKCTNCQRFSQDCIFTPVSAQTQAFVPAHTVYRAGTNPPANQQLYGAYGQPLYGGREQYPQQSPQQQQQQPQQPGQYAQPPPGYQQPHNMYGGLPPPQGTPGSDNGRKRLTDEPHTPTLPPPNPATQQRDGRPPYPYSDPSFLGHEVKDPDAVVAAAHAAAAAARRVEVKDAAVQVNLPIPPQEQAS